MRIIKSKLFILIAAGLCLGGTGIVFVRSQKPEDVKAPPHSGCEVSGHVIDDAGDPLAFARVTSPNKFATSVWPTVKTDTQGKFRLPGLTCGSNTIIATRPWKDGIGTTLESAFAGAAQQAELVLEPNQTNQDVELRIGPPPAIIYVQIRDVITKKGIPGAKATLRRVDDPNWYIQMDVGAEGRFHSQVPTVPFTIEITAPKYEQTPSTVRKPQPILLKSGEATKLTIELRKK